MFSKLIKKGEIMKKIISISLLCSLQLFCGSDETKPLLSKADRLSLSERVSFEDFHNAIRRNDVRFFQNNLKWLRSKSTRNWIGITSDADANIASKKAFVDSTSKATFFKERKSQNAQNELAKALAIKKIIDMKLEFRAYKKKQMLHEKQKHH